MNSQVAAKATTADVQDIGQRARRRVAYRLLPFFFLLYVIIFIVRVHVLFAYLLLSRIWIERPRLWFGVGMFYVTYVLFEIPGRSSSNAGARGSGLRES
jgi:hypothetical protein